MADLKLVELIIEDEETDFLGAMGLVSHPAIETDFIYFNKNKQNFVFGKEIEEGIIVSPALIPDKKIYRYNPITNFEYEVFFSKETVKKLSQNFLISGNHINTTLQHEHPIQGVHLIYSWIVENQQDQALSKYGFSVPDGTWMVSYKILNEDIKSKIKSGEISGVSIEAMLTEKFDSQTELSDEDKVKQIKDLLNGI